MASRSVPVVRRARRAGHEPAQRAPGRPGGSTALTIAFLTAGAGNLLFHLSAVRSVEPGVFADFGVAAALAAVVSIPLLAAEVTFGSAIARGLSAGRVSGDAVARRYLRLVVAPGLLGAVATGVLAAGVLGLTVLQAALLSVFMVAALHTTLGRALLIGGRHWAPASLAVMCAPAGRLLGLLLLLSVGHAGSATALLAVTVAGEAGGAAVAMQLARRKFGPDGADVDVSGRSLSVAFLSLTPVAVLMGADVLMARLALPAVEVGRIAAAASVARAALHLPQAIALSKLPDLSAGSGRRASTLLVRSVAILVLLLGCAAVLMVPLGPFVAGLLLGDATLGALLPGLLVVAGGAGLSNLVVTAMLARRLTPSVYVCAALPLLSLAFVLDSVGQVIVAAALLTVGTAAVGLWLFGLCARSADAWHASGPPRADAITGRSVSVVVPSYRPGPGFEGHLVDLVQQLATCGARDWEVVVVDDGCPERSAARADALRLPGVRVEVSVRNRGKGHAIRAGIAASRGDIVGFIDADGDITARHAVDLAVRLADERAAAVIGDKTHPGSVVHRSVLRRAATFLWGTLVQGLLGVDIADTQAGVKMWDGEVARWCARRSVEDGFAFDLEMLALTAQSGGRIVSAPVRIASNGHRSSIDARAVVSMVRAAIRVRRRTHVPPSRLDLHPGSDAPQAAIEAVAS